MTRLSSPTVADSCCTKCSSKIGERDFTVPCGGCTKLAHARCFNIDDDTYRKFDKAGSVPFIAPLCSTCSALHVRQHLVTPTSVNLPSAPDMPSVIAQVIAVLSPEIEKVVRNILVPPGTYVCFFC